MAPLPFHNYKEIPPAIPQGWFARNVPWLGFGAAGLDNVARGIPTTVTKCRKLIPPSLVESFKTATGGQSNSNPPNTGPSEDITNTARCICTTCPHCKKKASASRQQQQPKPSPAQQQKPAKKKK